MNSPFDPTDPGHWANLFAMALGKFGGGLPAPSPAPSPFAAQGNIPSSPGPFTGGTFPTAAEAPFFANIAAGPRPQQGQGLAQPDTYGGDEYAHAGWNTGAPLPPTRPEAPNYLQMLLGLLPSVTNRNYTSGY